MVLGKGISTRYGLNMDVVYENYVRQITGGALSANYTDASESLKRVRRVQ